MATEFSVELPNEPGQLAHLCEVLGERGVNIDAIQAWPCGDTATVQFLPSDVENTSSALDDAGIDYQVRQVLIVHVLDEPGNLGDVARVMAHAGINIDSVYATIGGKIVLGVDDLDGAIQVARGMAVNHV